MRVHVTPGPMVQVIIDEEEARAKKHNLRPRPRAEIIRELAEKGAAMVGNATPAQEPVEQPTAPPKPKGGGLGDLKG